MTPYALSPVKNVPDKRSTLKTKNDKSFDNSKKKSPKHLAIDDIELLALRQTSENEQEFMREKMLGEIDSTQTFSSSNLDSSTIDGCKNKPKVDSDVSSEDEGTSITRISAVNKNGTETEKVPKVPEASKFKPPVGFRLQTFQENSITSRLFSESNLEGKQVWCIAMPSHLEIKIFENLLTPANLDGANLISADGDEYELSNGQLDSQNLKILAPGDKAEGYRFVSKTISQKIYLSQTTRKPSISASKTKKLEAKITKPVRRPSRPQPKGLKMRFNHIGFDSRKSQNIGTESSSDSADEAEKVTVLNLHPISITDLEANSSC